MSTPILPSIELPPPEWSVMTLEEAISRRRSVRRFSARPLSRQQLSRILWASQGITAIPEGFRAVPSAGAVFPLELVVLCGRDCVENIAEGVYRYDPASHSLTLNQEGERRAMLARAALNQKMVSQAPLSIVICAEYEKTTRHYGQRGERYVHMEAGHAGQDIYLEATALGLATVAIGAFHDEQVKQVLKLREKWKPLYIMPVGSPA